MASGEEKVEEGAEGEVECVKSGEGRADELGLSRRGWALIVALRSGRERGKVVVAFRLRDQGVALQEGSPVQLAREASGDACQQCPVLSFCPKLSRGFQRRRRPPTSRSVSFARRRQTMSTRL